MRRMEFIFEGITVHLIEFQVSFHFIRINFKCLCIKANLISENVFHNYTYFQIIICTKHIQYDFNSVYSVFGKHLYKSVTLIFAFSILLH
jgi:hypothetical protein